MTPFLDSNVVLYALGDDEWEIAARYRYGHYDSLIVATAISAGCSILYTEDLQHGQSIDQRMTLIDPFQEAKA